MALRFPYALIVALAVCLVPGSARAQAICAAPHSAPSLRPSGSVETIEPLTGWVQFTALRQRSTEFYDQTGDLRPLLAESAITTHSFFLTGAFGITEGLDVWAQVPLHDLETQSLSGGSSAFDVGDVRLAARVGSELFSGVRLPVMLRAAIKLPGTEFPVDATIVPLTEGQVDWSLGLETGYYFGGSFPLQVVASAGHRWRGLNETVGYRPGDETFAYIGVGGPRARWRWGLAMEGLWGDPPVDNGLTLTGAARKLVQVAPSVAFRLGRGELDLALRLPVSGRNLASGRAFTVGFFFPWALP